MKGYAQKHDIDYDETFAPVVKMTTVCVLLVVVTAKGWHLHQIDVKNVFMQIEFEKWVYMIQIPEFQSGVNTSTVSRLKNSLYELKQALRAWTRRSRSDYIRWGLLHPNHILHYSSGRVSMGQLVF